MTHFDDNKPLKGFIYNRKNTNIYLVQLLNVLNDEFTRQKHNTTNPLVAESLVIQINRRQIYDLDLLFKYRIRQNN